MSQPSPARPSRSRVWTQSEAVTAASIWDRAISDHYGDEIHLCPPGLVRRTFKQIAIAIGREFAIVEYRYQHYGAAFGSNRRTAVVQAFAARDVRTQALLDASLTTRLFGDPPPGFSALDRRAAPKPQGCGGRRA